MEYSDQQIEEIIKRLGLTPLSEEGGLCAQTYVSTFRIDGKCAGTQIYYLLRGDSFSHLHRLDGDEIYHFYLGDPVELVELLPDGSTRTTVLGRDILNGMEVQHLVPHGTWQGSRLLSGSRFALLGTSMWPGYTQDGYEHGNREELIRIYPSCREKILNLTGEVSY